MEALMEFMLHSSMIDRQVNLYDLRCAEILMNNRVEEKLSKYDIEAFKAKWNIKEIRFYDEDVTEGLFNGGE